MLDARTAAIPLLVVANPVAIVVIARWVPVVRERRTRWFLIHAAAMTGIVVGWALRRPAAVPLNALWLVVSTVWYWLGGRRAHGDPDRPHLSRRRPPSAPGPR